MVKSELNGSEAINEAALSWASFAISVILVTAAVVIGFAIAATVDGNARAVPLLIIGLAEVAAAVRLIRRRVEFRRLSVGGTPPFTRHQGTNGTDQK